MERIKYDMLNEIGGQYAKKFLEAEDLDEVATIMYSYGNHVSTEIAKQLKETLDKDYIWE